MLIAAALAALAALAPAAAGLEVPGRHLLQRGNFLPTGPSPPAAPAPQAGLERRAGYVAVYDAEGLAQALAAEEPYIVLQRHLRLAAGWSPPPLAARTAIHGACSEADAPPTEPPSSTPLRSQQCVIVVAARRGAALAAAPGAALVLSNVAIRLAPAASGAGAAALNATGGARVALRSVTLEGQGGDAPAATLFLDSSSALLSDSAVVANVDSVGALVARGSALRLVRVAFLRNTAGGAAAQGAAVRAQGSRVEALGCTFTSNSAAGSGGALHITAPADTLLANSALADNRAGVAGGAIALAGAPGTPNTLRLLNGTFRSNSAPAGADIAVATPAATVLVGGRGGTPAQGIAGEGVGGAAWRPQLVSEAEVARGPAVPGTPALLSEEEAFIAEAATVFAAARPEDAAEVGGGGGDDDNGMPQWAALVVVFAAIAVVVGACMFCVNRRRRTERPASAFSQANAAIANGKAPNGAGGGGVAAAARDGGEGTGSGRRHGPRSASWRGGRGAGAGAVTHSAEADATAAVYKAAAEPLAAGARGSAPGGFAAGYAAGLAAGGSGSGRGGGAFNGSGSGRGAFAAAVSASDSTPDALALSTGDFSSDRASAASAAAAAPPPPPPSARPPGDWLSGGGTAAPPHLAPIPEDVASRRSRGSAISTHLSVEGGGDSAAPPPHPALRSGDPRAAAPSATPLAPEPPLSSFTTSPHHRAFQAPHPGPPRAAAAAGDPPAASPSQLSQLSQELPSECVSTAGATMRTQRVAPSEADSLTEGHVYTVNGQHSLRAALESIGATHASAASPKPLSPRRSGGASFELERSPPPRGAYDAFARLDGGVSGSQSSIVLELPRSGEGVVVMRGGGGGARGGGGGGEPTFRGSLRPEAPSSGGMDSQNFSALNSYSGVAAVDSISFPVPASDGGGAASVPAPPPRRSPERPHGDVPRADSSTRGGSIVMDLLTSGHMDVEDPFGHAFDGGAPASPPGAASAPRHSGLSLTNASLRHESPGAAGGSSSREDFFEARAAPEHAQRRTGRAGAPTLAAHREAA